MPLHRDCGEQPDHPGLEKFGKDLGVGLGVIVTEALAAVEGLERAAQRRAGSAGEEHPRRDAHREPRHPQAPRRGRRPADRRARREDKPGMVHDLLDGMGKGATEAPGDSYRLEAKVSDYFKKP